VGVGLMVACGVEGQGKHSCGTEPVLELEGGTCVFSLSCVGALSRTGPCKTVKALHLFPESLACGESGPCEITGLASDVFSGMDQLESLYLSHHSIDELPEGNMPIRRRTQARGLTHATQPLMPAVVSSSTDLFRDAKALQTLDLRSNGMKRVNATLFSGLEQLQRLHLSDNWLQELPNTLFEGLINLQVLTVR